MGVLEEFGAGGLHLGRGEAGGPFEFEVSIGALTEKMRRQFFSNFGLDNIDVIFIFGGAKTELGLDLKMSLHEALLVVFYKRLY